MDASPGIYLLEHLMGAGAELQALLSGGATEGCRLADQDGAGPNSHLRPSRQGNQSGPAQPDMPKPKTQPPCLPENWPRGKQGHQVRLQT